MCSDPIFCVRVPTNRPQTMPTLSVDHYFTIGTTHAPAGEPCQDYAISGKLSDGRVYGIVTDGCSGANARTDLGARVLALAMEAELQGTTSLDDCFTQEFVQRIRTRLLTMPLGGIAQDYLASIVAFCANTTTAKLFMAGDGAYATRLTNGTVQITEASWPDNAPYYLGYCIQPTVAAQFSASAANGTLSVQLTTKTSDADCTAREIPAQDFLQGWTKELDLTNTTALAIYTDGIGQVSKLVSLDAATACLAFKNYEGSFVKRRAMKALAQWGKSGHTPQDDFSIAALARFTAGPPQGVDLGFCQTPPSGGSDPRSGGAWGPRLQRE